MDKTTKKEITSVGVEVAKALILLALQEAAKAGMSLAEIDKLYQKEKAEFRENNPDKIPDLT